MLFSAQCQSLLCPWGGPSVNLSVCLLNDWSVFNWSVGQFVGWSVPDFQLAENLTNLGIYDPRCRHGKVVYTVYGLVSLLRPKGPDDMGRGV